MTGFLSVQTVYVSKDLALQAQAHLQRMGEFECEGFALWAGTFRRDAFYVKHTIVPVQTPLRFSNGVCIYVDAEELHRVNVWLYEHGVTIIAQLHSHPEDAYHSSTDDTFPISTSLGSFSLVVPYFAKQPFMLSNCAVYRLLDIGWTPLTRSEIERTIIITE